MGEFPSYPREVFKMIKTRRNERFKRLISSLFIILFIISINYGCGTSYRKAIESKGVEYSEESFIRQAAKGNTENVELFLKEGINVNYKDQSNSTALILAAANGHIDIVKLLLAKGADINAVDNNNSSALLHATYNNHVEIVKLLIENKANLNIKNSSKETALMYAKRVNYVEITKLLNDVGARDY